MNGILKAIYLPRIRELLSTQTCLLQHVSARPITVASEQVFRIPLDKH